MCASWWLGSDRAVARSITGSAHSREPPGGGRARAPGVGAPPGGGAEHHRLDRQQVALGGRQVQVHAVGVPARRDRVRPVVEVEVLHRARRLGHVAVGALAHRLDGAAAGTGVVVAVVVLVAAVVHGPVALALAAVRAPAAALAAVLAAGGAAPPPRPVPPPFSASLLSAAAPLPLRGAPGGG